MRNEKLKRILAILMVITMCMSMFPTSVFADGGMGENILVETDNTVPGEDGTNLQGEDYPANGDSDNLDQGKSDDPQSDIYKVDVKFVIESDDGSFIPYTSEYSKIYAETPDEEKMENEDEPFKTWDVSIEVEAGKECTVTMPDRPADISEEEIFYGWFYLDNADVAGKQLFTDFESTFVPVSSGVITVCAGFAAPAEDDSDTEIDPEKVTDPADERSLESIPALYELSEATGSLTIKFTKNWSDNENHDGVRPNDIRITLKRYAGEFNKDNLEDVEEYKEPIVVSKAMNWTYEFTLNNPQLYKGDSFSADNVYKYYVVEDEIAGYQEIENIPPVVIFEPPTVAGTVVYRPCNVLDIVSDGLVKSIVITKPTKSESVIVWTPDALTSAEQEIIK